MKNFEKIFQIAIRLLPGLDLRGKRRIMKKIISLKEKTSVYI